MTARRYLTQRQKAELMLRQGGKCAGCGCRLMAGLFEPAEFTITVTDAGRAALQEGAG